MTKTIIAALTASMLCGLLVPAPMPANPPQPTTGPYTVVCEIDCWGAGYE